MIFHDFVYYDVEHSVTASCVKNFELSLVLYGQILRFSPPKEDVDDYGNIDFSSDVSVYARVSENQMVYAEEKGWCFVDSVLDIGVNFYRWRLY